MSTNTKQTGPVTAVIYARVSSVAQMQKGDGLGSQETRRREYARAKGYTVAEVFCDEAVSGSVTDRPGMQAMLSYLRKRRGLPHVVLIDDISRLARGIGAHLELRAWIAATGAELQSPSITFGEDSESKFMEHMSAALSEFQRGKNAEQTKNRMLSRIQNGYWPFIACMGLRYVRSPGRGKMLVRDEPIASIIAEALEGYASGRFETQAEVKRFFESQPAFPKNARGEVRNQLVTDILTKPLYAGYLAFPDWGISLRKGEHEGLVSFETFLRVQERLSGNARAPARTDLNEEFVLRGAVACARCDKPLTASWSRSKTGTRHAYYHCFNRQCSEKGKAIRRERIEGEFASLLDRLSPDRALVDLVRALFAHGWEQRRAQAHAYAKTCASEIEKLDKQITGLLTRVVEASTPSVIAAYEERIATLEAKKLSLEEKRAASGQTRGTFEEMFERAMSFFASPSKLWHSGEFAHRRLVLKLTFASKLRYSRQSGYSNPETALPFKLLTEARDPGNAMADREGFEPSRRFPAYTLSRRAPSTTRPSVPRRGFYAAGPVRATLGGFAKPGRAR